VEAYFNSKWEITTYYDKISGNKSGNKILTILIKNGNFRVGIIYVIPYITKN
jgi:hypothetical protein